jgi:hypothetical protein
MSINVKYVASDYFNVQIHEVWYHTNWGTQYFPTLNLLVPGASGQGNDYTLDIDTFQQAASPVNGQNDLFHSKVRGDVTVRGAFGPDQIKETWSDPIYPWPRETRVYAKDGSVIWSGDVVLAEGGRSFIPPDTQYHRLTTFTVSWIEEGTKVRIVIRDEWSQGFGWETDEQSFITDEVQLVASYPLPIVDWNWFRMDPQLYGSLCSVAEYDGMKSFGTMCLEAAQTARFCDVNGIAYLKDAFELVKFATGLAQGASGLAKNLDHALSFGKAAIACKNGKQLWRHAKPALKDAASLYLANHYGTRLTVKDTIEIANALDELAPPVGQQTQRVGSSENHSVDWSFPTKHPHKISHVALRRRATMDIAVRDWESAWFIDKMKMTKRALYEADLWPTASNLWDMVPFSFVADWFGPTGEEFEYQEKVGYMRTLPILRTFCSSKATFSVEFLRDSGFEGKLMYTVYQRQCTSAPPPPPLTANAALVHLPNWKNGIEAGALVTSMKL